MALLSDAERERDRAQTSPEPRSKGEGRGLLGQRETPQDEAQAKRKTSHGVTRKGGRRMCALFVGFSDERRFFVLVFVFFVFLFLFLFLLIIIVRISRRRRIADKPPVDQPAGNVRGDVRSSCQFLPACWDIRGEIKVISARETLTIRFSAPKKRHRERRHTPAAASAG